MLTLAAYADRLSVRPGETISFSAASTTGRPIDASLVRVVCADANPAGPGIVTEPVESEVSCIAEPRPQSVPSGSYGIINNVPHIGSGGSFTLACTAFPTAPGDKIQTLLSTLTDTERGGAALVIGENGKLRALAGNNDEPRTCEADITLMARRWYRVWITFDAQTGVLGIGASLLDKSLVAGSGTGTGSLSFSEGTVPGSTTLMLAAQGEDKPTNHFNGKLESPTLWDRALSETELASLCAGDTSTGVMPAGAACTWNLCIDHGSSRIVDDAVGAHHGKVVNTPTRAVTGSTWTGREMRFSDAPDQFAAIHFHDDDLDDCCWPVCFEWTVPDGTRSSVYALMLESDGAQENVPFHVVPPRGTRTARIAVLASTFTYIIYANHARPEWDKDTQWRNAWIDQSAAWGGSPHNPGEHRDYGLSTYNHHSDGSGIAISSARRPMLNVRIGYITYPYEEIRGSGLRHFPADSHLNAWLEQQGHDYDIVTDWELHTEGHSVLDGYDVVLTGTHPEYHTRQTLDALVDYRNGGGRFCYLGGNGFYWKVALSNELDGVIEIRRGEGGIRAWAADPGEYYNQFDGEYGGLWRRNGRPPQDLCGIGFTAQGNFSGSHYRKTAQSNDERVAWLLKGIDTDTLGGHGLSAHGAAGFELDRVDKRLGTPVHAVVVASSENHPPEAPWILVPEEMLTHITTWPGVEAAELIRADMTFFETPAGGAVFSSGSITFCGSLLTNGGDNDISQLMNNVVERFLDPTPFEMPVE
jgi:N,N-dimethylformamidase